MQGYRSIPWERRLREVWLELILGPHETHSDERYIIILLSAQILPKIIYPLLLYRSYEHYILGITLLLKACRIQSRNHAEQSFSSATFIYILLLILNCVRLLHRLHSANTFLGTTQKWATFFSACSKSSQFITGVLHNERLECFICFRNIHIKYYLKPNVARTIFPFS
jgi:hypothetical protein